MSALEAWHRRLGTVLFIIFCFEIGLFLLVFPWLGPWANNWMADLVPWARDIWDNPFFRGGVSGLGALNLVISFNEIGKLLRTTQ